MCLCFDRLSGSLCSYRSLKIIRSDAVSSITYDVPLHQLRGLGSAAVSCRSGVPGGVPTAEGFSCITCRQIVSPCVDIYYW